MSTPQEEFWAGPEGDTYQQRNRVDWKARLPFWDKIVAMTNPTSVLEVGCGPGWNLMALRAIEHVGPFVRGIDVNQAAVDEARREHLDVAVCRALDAGWWYPEMFDLTFTCGLLIHISPEDLDEVMTSIIKTSTRYVLAIEYEAHEEQQVEYRGQPGLLWKRPFGALYEAHGLKLVKSGPAGEGFDNCTWWIMEKNRD
jgi:pseudaminic acid biosynthesis-associated methylase